MLSDRKAGGLCAEDTYIPPLLAAGAVHHHLSFSIFFHINA